MASARDIAERYIEENLIDFLALNDKIANESKRRTKKIRDYRVNMTTKECRLIMAAMIVSLGKSSKLAGRIKDLAGALERVGFGSRELDI